MIFTLWEKTTTTMVKREDPSPTVKKAIFYHLQLTNHPNSPLGFQLGQRSCHDGCIWHQQWLLWHVTSDSNNTWKWPFNRPNWRFNHWNEWHTLQWVLSCSWKQQNTSVWYNLRGYSESPVCGSNLCSSKSCQNHIQIFNHHSAVINSSILCYSHTVQSI